MAAKKPQAGKPVKKMSSAFGMLGGGVAAILAAWGAWWAFSGSTPAVAAPGEVVVFKAASCGCCGGWVDHMRRSGFKVTVNDVSDVDPYKEKFGVPYAMGSCHTAMVDGYVIEGHVPAEDIRRFLSEKPNAKGLAAPGMPIGSPGMEQGGARERYNVIMFGLKGNQVYAQH